MKKEKQLKEELNIQLFTGEGGEGDNQNQGNQGNQGNQNQGNQNQGNQGQNQNTGNNDVTFTQAQLSAVAAREKNDGRKSAYSSLGIDGANAEEIAEAAAAIKAAKEAKAAANKNSGEEITKELSAAKSEVAMANTKIALLSAGVKAEYLNDAVTLMLAAVNEAEGKTQEVVLNEMKEKYAIWWGNENNGTRTPSGTGSNMNKNQTKKDGELSLGERLAGTRKNSAAKKSFWD